MTSAPIPRPSTIQPETQTTFLEEGDADPLRLPAPRVDRERFRTGVSRCLRIYTTLDRGPRPRHELRNACWPSMSPQGTPLGPRPRPASWACASHPHPPHQRRRRLVGEPHTGPCCHGLRSRFGTDPYNIATQARPIGRFDLQSSSSCPLVNASPDDSGRRRTVHVPATSRMFPTRTLGDFINSGGCSGNILSQTCAFELRLRCARPDVCRTGRAAALLIGITLH